MPRAAAEKESGHGCCHRNVRPAAAGPHHQTRRRDHGRIVNGVSARTRPDGAHIGVAVAKAHEQTGTDHVGQQGDQAHAGHEDSIRRLGIQRAEWLMTPRVWPYVKEPPAKSRASARRACEPAACPATTSTRNMVRLMASTQARARRGEAPSNDWSSAQQATKSAC
jgi:hypothetical protein